MEIYLELLNESDFKELFSFELKNKDYFEEFVPARPQEYFEYSSFCNIMDELINEQNQNSSKFYLIKNISDDIVGRINLTNINSSEKSADLGYRIGEEYCNKGLASKALSLLIKNLDVTGINTIYSMTTKSNIGSQKVMLKNGFIFLRETDEKFITNKINNSFIHFVFKMDVS